MEIFKKNAKEIKSWNYFGWLTQRHSRDVNLKSDGDL